MATVTAKDDTSQAVKVTLDGNTAGIGAGGNGSAGALALFNAAGKWKVEISAGPFTLTGRAIPPNVLIDGTAASLHLKVQPEGGISLAAQPEALINAHSIGLWSAENLQSVNIDGRKGTLTLHDDKGNERIALDAAKAYGALGGAGHDGQLGLFPADATNISDTTGARILLDGRFAQAGIGGAGSGGQLGLFPAEAINIRDRTEARIWLDGQYADVSIGGAGYDGSVVILPATGLQNRIQLNGKDATVGIGNTISADGKGAVLKVGNITLDGNAGNISASGNIIASGSPPIAERSTSVPLSGQTIQLFPLGQDGAYIVELAACYSQADTRSGQRIFGYAYVRWAVFTYHHTLGDKLETRQYDAQTLAGGAGGSDSSSFWSEDPSFDASGDFVQLRIPGLANPPNNPPNDTGGKALLSVKAFFGSLPTW